jgi:hypothetical protein
MVDVDLELALAESFPFANGLFGTWILSRQMVGVLGEDWLPRFPATVGSFAFMPHRSVFDGMIEADVLENTFDNSKVEAMAAVDEFG